MKIWRIIHRFPSPTIARLESIGEEISGRPKTVQKIRDALEKAGVEFIDENGGRARRATPQAPTAEKKQDSPQPLS